MKKLAILALFLVPLATFGAVSVVKEIKCYDFIAQIQTSNNGNIFINKVVDGDNTCYVMHSDNTKWGGINYGISCVSVVKK